MDPDLPLLERVARGDERALAELYRRHAPRVYALGLKLLGSPEEAEEVVQDTFLKLYRKADSYRGYTKGYGRRAKVGTFLYSVARNEALMRLRARRSRPRRADACDPHDPGSALAAPASADPTDALLVEGALARLDPADRRLVQLAFFWGHSHRELAELTGTPLGTVKSRLRRALLRLREDLEEREEQEEHDGR